MYEETALEILDPHITEHEEAHIEDFFRLKKSCDPSWTASRRDWAFAFFGAETWKNAVNFIFIRNDVVVPVYSYLFGFVKFVKHADGARSFNKCRGLHEMTVDYDNMFAAAGGREVLDLKLLIPLWKNRLFQALFNRKAGAIASINRKQESLLPALLDLGFKIQSEWMYNPNSGNEIMLLFFQFPR